MTKYRLTDTCFSEFRQYLGEDEREPATIEKYLRDVQAFVVWLEEQPICKENGKLSALNKFLAVLRWTDCQVKYLKFQRRVFGNTEKELSKEEYIQLIDTAHSLESVLKPKYCVQDAQMEK